MYLPATLCRLWGTLCAQYLNLSPLESAFTPFAAVTPLESAFTKNTRGGGTPSRHCYSSFISLPGEQQPRRLRIYPSATWLPRRRDPRPRLGNRISFSRKLSPSRKRDLLPTPSRSPAKSSPKTVLPPTPTSCSATSSSEK